MLQATKILLSLEKQNKSLKKEVQTMQENSESHLKSELEQIEELIRKRMKELEEAQ